MEDFSFRGPQQRVDANNWPNCSYHSLPQSCWYPNSLWNWKKLEGACVLSIESHSFIFIQRNFWFYVDQSPIYCSLKFPLALKLCSFKGNWLLKRFQGRNSCSYSVLSFGSWSFWDVGIFEELIVFLLLIFALPEKIDQDVIPVSSRVFLQYDPHSRYGQWE